jgi:carbon-monoxide dehydrogenase medium subunit
MKSGGGKIARAAVGITGVSHHAYRAAKVEAALAGQPASAIAAAAEHVLDGADVLGDYYASAEYRGHLAKVLMRRTLEQAAKGRAL